MRGFGAFLRKEVSEIFRTWRIWVLPGIILFFATTGPLLARFQAELIATVMPAGQGGISIQVPEPTYADAYLQWTKNLSQLVLFAVIIMFGGMVSGEKRSGTAVLVLTKPISRAAFIMAKFVSYAGLLVSAVVVGALLTWGITYAIFGEAPFTQIAEATAVWLVFAVLFVALMELLSAALDSQAGAAGLGFLAYILLSIASLWGPLFRYSPAGLISAPNALIIGEADSLLWPIVASVLLTLAALAGSVAIFRRREL